MATGPPILITWKTPGNGRRLMAAEHAFFRIEPAFFDGQPSRRPQRIDMYFLRDNEAIVKGARTERK